MKAADIVIDGRTEYLTRIGDELARVVIVRETTRTTVGRLGDLGTRRAYIVRRAKDPAYMTLPKPRTAAALRPIEGPSEADADDSRRLRRAEGYERWAQALDRANHTTASWEAYTRAQIIRAGGEP